VREGNRNLRSGLRVKSESDVENLCTCRESREWGKICAHALAVGLAFIEQAAARAQPPSFGPVAPVASPPPGPTFVETGSESAIPLLLHFILPPSLESAWAKSQIMVVTEVELGGRRVMPTALQSNERYGCDTFDLTAIDGLRELLPDEPALAAMRLYPRSQFLRLLRALRGHPRVTFGKSGAVEVAPHAPRRRLFLRQANDGFVSARLDLAENERVLSSDDEVWLQEGNRVGPFVEGLPAEFRTMLDGVLSLRGERAQHFLAFEVQRLRQWFDLETEAGWALPEVQKATPEILLNVEGSLREIRAELRARYRDGLHRIETRSVASPDLLVVQGQTKEGTILLRDIEYERAAFARLERLGFTTRGDRLVLAGENHVARFFAFEFPRLQTDWKVSLSAQATKASGELQPLAPKLEVVNSGEDWFELRYSLGTPDGQAFSASELQRLLRSGQSQTRLRNGRTGVFDAEAISDFEEVLRDCEPRQNRPGVYRISRAHSQYFAATAEETGAALVDLRGALQRLASSEPRDLTSSLGSLRTQLRDYQSYGVSWLWKLAEGNLGGILADEMGLGKTVQMLALLLARRGSGPALIVCPTSLLTNWRNEAQRFTPALRVLLLEGAGRHASFAQIAESDLVLTSYALLQRDADRYKAIQFSTVVLDEAQHIKNPDTQNAQAAYALRAPHRFVLTGTPMENSVRDLWSLMHFALPGYLGTRADFRARYEQPLARGGAPEVQRRLARRLRPFLLRRKKTDVAKELPEKLEQQLVCDLTATQRAAYDGLLHEIQTGVASEKGNPGAVRMKMLLGLLRLRQVCCDLRLLRANEGGEKNESAKLDLLDELLEEAIDGGHRVLVFSQFVTMLALIRERLAAQKITYAYLDGQTKERQSVVDRFQKDDSLPVFLMSLKAGGVGLNLSAADTVIHFDPWWNYAVESQATDRAHRIGQTRVVTAYKLIARNTVEEKIVKLQTRKRSASEATVGTEEPLMSGLTTADLEELLS
ncbi:MAG: DEAD/DEAH box helicase, partial [Verrucomicrobiota bacterium]|nr:DEAD/DEAH box helicase [Verrucomicrobiota bacterium]